MKRRALVSLSAILLLSTFLAASVAGAPGSRPKILAFDAMVGVPAGLTGSQSQAPLRGINGGGVPWVIAAGSGELSVARLEVTVEGLVLATGANAGSNPIATFRGLVSCVRSDGSFQNILTDPFPATTGPASAGGGNAKIEADVSLPQPCIAPIVFVTSPGGSWFAATGF
jgi:hypothetical protein